MLKPLIKETVIYGLGDFVFKCVNFLTFPIFAHLFTVDQFGVFSLATTLAALIAVIFNCGINNAVQRYYMDRETSEEEQKIYATTGLACLIFFSIIASSLSLIFTYAYRDQIYARDHLPWELIAIAIVGILPAQIFQFSVDLIRLHFRPWTFFFLNVWQNVLSIGLSLFFVLYLKMGIIGYLFGTVLSFTLVAPFALWNIRFSFARKLSLEISQKLIRFGYPFIFAGIAYWIFGSLDRWMIAELGRIEDVGIFSTAFKLGTLIIFINTAFGNAWSPQALKLYKTEPNYRHIYSRLFSLWFFFLIFVGASLSLFAEEFLWILTPSSFWPAASIIPYIAFGLVLCGTTQMTAIGISLERKTFHLSIATWTTAAINFLLNLYLIPRYGAEGAAIATLLSYLTLTTYYLICTQSLHPLPLSYKALGSGFLMIISTLWFSYFVLQLPQGEIKFLIKIGYLMALIITGAILEIFHFSDFHKVFRRAKAEINT